MARDPNLPDGKTNPVTPTYPSRVPEMDERLPNQRPEYGAEQGRKADEMFRKSIDPNPLGAPQKGGRR